MIKKKNFLNRKIKRAIHEKSCLWHKPDCICLNCALDFEDCCDIHNHQCSCDDCDDYSPEEQNADGDEATSLLNLICEKCKHSKRGFIGELFACRRCKVIYLYNLCKRSEKNADRYKKSFIDSVFEMRALKKRCNIRDIKAGTILQSEQDYSREGDDRED